MNIWQVGDVTITRVIEMEITGGTRFILPQATPSAIEDMEWMVPHFATAEGKLIMSVHALVVDTPSQRIIVDTCIGNDKSRSIPPGAIFSFPSWRTWRRRATQGKLSIPYSARIFTSIMSVGTRC